MIIRGDCAWLAVLAAVFLVWHVPLEYRTGGGQDEEWYAVAGSMVLRGGVPRVPYSPSRDPTSAGYKADVALYALPPLNSYVQALTHLILGDGLGPARLTSTLLGLAAVFLVYALARLWYDDSRVAVLAALAFISSRAFLFPATMSRPDMLTATCGLLGLWFVVYYQRTRSYRELAMSGVAIGLAFLSHPFGLVPAVQVGLTVLATGGRPKRRFGTALIYAGIALGVFALWLPLIALHPDVFRNQFGANVLSRAGPGLGNTLLRPRSVVLYQANQFWQFVGSLQGATYALALAWVLVRARRERAGRESVAHCVGSAALLVLLEGKHPTLGYYVYPVALTSIAVGKLAGDWATIVERRAGRAGKYARLWITALASCGVLVAFLPGSGVRTVWAHLQHARDPSYDAHAVARAVVADLPKSALVAVDGGYVLDVYFAHRNVVEMTIHPLMFDVRELPFEYAVFGRPSLKLYKNKIADLVFVKSYGKKEDPFAEYAELYRRERGRDENGKAN